MNIKIPKGVKIVKGVDWNKVDMLICNSKGYFKDDIHGECHECGAKIVYRPYHPKDVKKVCIECSLKLIKK